MNQISISKGMTRGSHQWLHCAGWGWKHPWGWDNLKIAM